MTTPNEPSRPTVLAIDDTPENLSLLHAILADEYDVKVANGATRGLAIANGEDPPDIILLDVMMPVMDGFEVCRLLKESEATRDIPVVFLTGKADPEDEDRGLAAGAVDYIAKPLNPSVVLQRIRTQLQLRYARHELALRDAQMAARELDDLERDKAMGLFESVISHDVRASLSVISGYAGLLRKKVEGDERALNYLSPIRDGAKRLAGMAAQWRELARALRRTMRPEMLNMQAKAQEILDQQLAAHKSRQAAIAAATEGAAVAIEIRVDLGELPGAWGDAAATRQVWEQLISNAIAAMRTTASPLLRIHARELKGEVAYTVEDNGIGFPEEDIERLFKPFEHLGEEVDADGADTEHEGPALGLFVANQAVRRMGGRMWATGQSGKGASFHFSLPSAAPGSCSAITQAAST